MTWIIAACRFNEIDKLANVPRKFDFVISLRVFYHLRHPRLMLDKLAAQLLPDHVPRHAERDEGPAGLPLPGIQAEDTKSGE